MERDVLPQGGETLPTEENVLERGETQVMNLPESAEERRLAKEVAFLKEKLALYEQNGAAKLYYSLNRKMTEMADLMNNIGLKNLDLTDGKDKSFERIKTIWDSAAKVAEAAKSIGELAGVTGDEKKDVGRKPFNDRLAEERR
jgi:hypothetical protein